MTAADGAGDRPQPPTVIAMLGGPGSGKGTQCTMLAQTFDIEHVSIGDLLRLERNSPGSKYGQIIRDNIAAGRLGAKEMTVDILGDHMKRSTAQGTRAFLIDGFPRDKDRCEYFEQLMGPILFLIVLECPDDVMMERLTGSDRGRADDNPENIKRRIEMFKKTTHGVVDIFRDRGRVRFVNSNQDVDSVRLEIEAILEGLVERRSLF
ncbi:adenylate kinase-domain-containing protein [Lasiosphaeria ovina]|uniref:Adenylate kinase-domain-containing protein n=1 Tax=Lasiosphaeria ovina TaxID=92902 RepID=A0AAE0JS99_9PEZI|nr:adenylate kinase-domain-containing protein [Lasiosphaeria ovina]